MPGLEELPLIIFFGIGLFIVLFVIAMFFKSIANSGGFT